jgi:pyrroline-5-carboxylate reductase
MKEAIGIIGFGNMGQAMAERIKSAYEVIVFDKDETKTKDLSGIKAAKDIADLVKSADVIILAVKPQDFDAVLTEIKGKLIDKLVISIAAGINTGYIEKILGKMKVIRLMPNLPARVAKAFSFLSKGAYASETDLDYAAALFRCMGETLSIDENLMDAATAVSGSGPGFFFYLIQNKAKEEWLDFSRSIFIPALAASAQRVGFTGELAQKIAKIVVEGSLVYLEKSGLTPKECAIQVTSKGGTTEAGLEVLHKGGSLEEAVIAASRRAGELSKKE